MDRVIKINQAYSLTPWRKQLQWIGLFLSVLVIFAVIAGVYLNVNAKAATIGRQIQNDRNRINELENSIADQESQLASVTSISAMEERALTLGFRYANSDEILYLPVEGYNGRPPAVLASETREFVPSRTPTLSPAFTQSLLEWIRERVKLPSVMFESVMP